MTQRIRCDRRRQGTAPKRCMGDLNHEGLHWCWVVDDYREWNDSVCSPHRARKSGMFEPTWGSGPHRWPNP